MNCQRRNFIFYAAGASTLTGTLAFAQSPSPELVKDTDANAVALGYSSDGSKTDAKIPSVCGRSKLRSLPALHRYSQRYQRRVPGIRKQGCVSQGLVQRLVKERLITFGQRLA